MLPVTSFRSIVEFTDYSTFINTRKNSELNRIKKIWGMPTLMKISCNIQGFSCETVLKHGNLNLYALEIFYNNTNSKICSLDLPLYSRQFFYALSESYS